MTTTDVVAARPSALAVSTGQSYWTEEQLAALRQIGVDKATPGDLAVFLNYAQRTGLDPFSRQLYMIGRWDARTRSEKWTIQASIDGLRIVAQRSGDYRGQIGPEWCGPDGAWRDVWLGEDPPAAARVGVLRDGFAAPLYAVALFREYAATDKDGRLSRMWREKGALMIAKCFDAETEVLTESGYRRFADVGDLRIMQVTDGGLEAVAARPFSQSYSGLMVLLDSDDLNFSVTPNHDMVTTVGKVEAGAMYATSRSRPTWTIPRIPPTNDGAGIDLPEEVIRLAAAVVSDGCATTSGWKVEVSRPHKVDALRAMGLHDAEYVRRSRGAEAVGKSGRIVRTNFDKAGFKYRRGVLDGIVDQGKHLVPATVRAMSSKQARALVDALIDFDGSRNRRTGVRRFYTSDQHTLGMFELAATIAGYTVNRPVARGSDLSDRVNWYVAISERDAIGVVRRSDGGTSLTLTPNGSSSVWCVTVPSGRIMVRRRGFAMVCGNCAEALALRKAFPHDLSGVYTAEEMSGPHSAAPVIAAPVTGEDQRAAARVEREWLDAVAAATSVEELRAIWRAARQAGQMTPELHAAVDARVEALSDPGEAEVIDVDPETGEVIPAGLWDGEAS